MKILTSTVFQALVMFSAGLSSVSATRADSDIEIFRDCSYDDDARPRLGQPVGAKDINAQVSLVYDTGLPSPGSKESPVKCGGAHPAEGVVGTEVNGPSLPLCMGRIVCSAQKKRVDGANRAAFTRGYVAADVICPAFKDKGGKFACPLRAEGCLKASLLPNDLDLATFHEGDSSMGSAPARN